MIRLLLDQGLAPLAATTLCDFGFDAVHVSESASRWTTISTRIWQCPELEIHRWFCCV
jgi:hypothetical protein